MINKHNQKLIIILENQYGGFLEILIFPFSLSRTHLQSKKFFILYTKLKVKTKINMLKITIVKITKS